MACCCLLVISAGYLHQGLRTALFTTVGHKLGQRVLATVQQDGDAGIRYFLNVESAAQSVAGVRALAWAARLPGSRPAWQSFRIEPQQLPAREIRMDVAALTSESLALFQFPPKAGRSFGLVDQACRSAIVNEDAAKILFDDATVGRMVQDPAGMPVEIIGVVARKETRSAARLGRPTIFYDYTNHSRSAFAPAPSARFRAPVAATLNRVELNANMVSPGYFAVMEYSLVAGRLFPDDPKTHRCRIGVLNKEAADQYFGGNATGGAVIDDVGRRTDIIGVVLSAQRGTFQRGIEPAIYFPMMQDHLPRMTLLLAATANEKLLPSLRSTIDAVWRRLARRVPEKKPGQYA
jgi:hypothetical protein